MAKNQEQSKNITTYRERETATRGRHDNIRQVGSVTGNRKIYIEDYVTSYIAHMAGDKDREYAQAVLLGKTEKKNDSTEVYISGAVHINEEFPEGKSAFSNAAWEVLYEDIKKYFNGLEVVGWVRCVDEAEEGDVDDNIAYIHQNQFSGSDKLLLLYASLEKEMFFYVRSHGSMQWQPGYYIYYEKNEAMKNYRLDHQNAISEEQQYEDTVLEGVRKKMVKKEQEHARKTAYIVGGTGVIAATALLFLVATMQNNAAKIQELETTIEAMTDSMEDGAYSAGRDNTDKSDTGKDDTDKGGTGKGNAGGDSAGNGNAGGDSAGNGSAAGKDSAKISDTMEGDGINDRENDRRDTSLSGGAGAATGLPEDERKEDVDSDADDGEDGIPNVNGGEGETDTEKSGDKKQAVQAAAIQEYYTVKKGDTLSQISCDFYHSVSYTELICEANDIHDADAIFEGQVLAIPKK